jgi:hypothetical protein
MEEPSIGGARYLAVWTDEWSRWVIVKPLKLKSDFLASFKVVLKEIKALGFKIKELRTDRGGEFVSKEVKDYCCEHEILHTFSGPYAPQQQGISERMNRFIAEMARAMLFRAGMTRDFWAEATNTAVYLINRIPREEGVSPYFKVFKKHPRVSHLRVFGCRAYVQIPKYLRYKLDPRAWAGVFLGYDESNWRSFRIWNPETRKVRIAVHVTFKEHIFPMIQHHAGIEPAVPNVVVEILGESVQRGVEQAVEPPVPPVLPEPLPQPESQLQTPPEQIPESNISSGAKARTCTVTQTF